MTEKQYNKLAIKLLKKVDSYSEIVNALALRITDLETENIRVNNKLSKLNDKVNVRK